ncbi:hypothetical protein D3C81_1494310 [compost metagenome]
MLHVAAIPDDFVDLRFHTFKRVGQFRDQIGSADGKRVAERRAAALKSVEFGAGGA